MCLGEPHVRMVPLDGWSDANFHQPADACGEVYETEDAMSRWENVLTSSLAVGDEVRIELRGTVNDRASDHLYLRTANGRLVAVRDDTIARCERHLPPWEPQAGQPAIYKCGRVTVLAVVGDRAWIRADPDGLNYVRPIAELSAPT